MRLGNQRASHNVEDRRGMGMVGGLGVGGIVIAQIAYFLGVDPGAMVDWPGRRAAARRRSRWRKAPPAPSRASSSRRFSAAPRTCGRDLPDSGSEYRTPTLVLYDGQVRSACGMGQAAMGPFYCPGDEKLYIDSRSSATCRRASVRPATSAQAYGIAHEVGHHVQKLTGSFKKLEAARGRVSQAEFNRLSVRIELQADCYAGAWGYHAGAMKQLEAGDIEEALGAATAIGDDRLQTQTRLSRLPTAAPSSVYAGSGAVWTGDPKVCDTFSAAAL